MSKPKQNLYNLLYGDTAGGELLKSDWFSNLMIIKKELEEKIKKLEKRLGNLEDGLDKHVGVRWIPVINLPKKVRTAKKGTWFGGFKGEKIE